MMYLRNASLHIHIKIETLPNHFPEMVLLWIFKSRSDSERSSLHPLPNISLSLVFLAST